jgi:hypothetical protein
MEQGSGGGGGSPAPLALNAWDLYRRIDETATYMYWTNKGDQPLSSFKLGARIQYWAARSLVSQEKIDETTKVLAGWVSDIEQLFNPGKTIRIPGKCPDCGKDIYTAVEDGETIRKPALTAHPGTYGTYATCGNCNQRWAGPELNELKLQQMIQEQKEAERMKETGMTTEHIWQDCDCDEPAM